MREEVEGERELKPYDAWILSKTSLFDESTQHPLFLEGLFFLFLVFFFFTDSKGGQKKILWNFEGNMLKRQRISLSVCLPVTIFDMLLLIFYPVEKLKLLICFFMLKLKI